MTVTEIDRRSWAGGRIARRPLAVAALLVLALVGAAGPGRAGGTTAVAASRHPEVLVRPGDLGAIRAKIDGAPWARQAFADLKARVDPYVARTQADPKYVTSRLFLNWKTHFTQPIVVKERWARGEGSAPEPTVRYAGARDWATDWVTPDSVDDFRPYNDAEDGSGHVWLLSKTTGKGEWVDPGQTGRTIEVANVRILRLAADAAFVYWVTGDEKYAAFAAPILSTYLRALSYVQLPKDETPGGKPNRIIGLTSFEVIHEESLPPLGLAYDFLHDYLVRKGTDTAPLQAQLKRLADRIIDGGNPTGNWNLNQANLIAYGVLPLDDDDAFPDHKGREYYAGVLLNARLPAQTGIVHVLREGYDPRTGLWPEAPGYGFGTTPQIVQIASMLRSDKAGGAVLDDPFLTKAILAQLELLYPNGVSIGLGDTTNALVRTDGLELTIAAARRRGDAATEARLTAALQREIDAGRYDRSRQSEIGAIAQYVDRLKPVPAAAAASSAGSRSFFGDALDVFLQRSPGADSDHALEAALYGTRGGHVHANGLAMELYGAGMILGADPGRGASYWTKDHRDYYSRPAAHNTVIVDGRSGYNENARPQSAMRVLAAEPRSGAPAVSPDVGFVTASFHYGKPAADQQRTVALVRLGARSGFYVDVFRSRETADPASGFHDYLYHETGQSLSLADAATGAPLALSATSLLGTKHGDAKGYDYFQDERSAAFAGDLHGTFTAEFPDGARRQMAVWMPGQVGRTVFSLAAPKNNAARSTLPAVFGQIPMPTLLVRQKGDAWAHPFVAVYEPYLGSDGAMVRSVRVAKGAAGGLAGAVVAGHSPEGDFTALIAESAAGSGAGTLEGWTFEGAFATVLTRGGQPAELYLGRGRTLSGGLAGVTAASTEPADACLIRTAEGWRCTASVPVTVRVPFPAASGRAGSVTLRDTSGRTSPASVVSWTVERAAPSGPVAVATVRLPACRDVVLLPATAPSR